MLSATDEKDRDDMARLVAGRDGALDDLIEVVSPRAVT
jgi:hypothetical protein